MLITMTMIQMLIQNAEFAKDFFNSIIQGDGILDLREVENPEGWGKVTYLVGIWEDLVCEHKDLFSNVNLTVWLSGKNINNYRNWMQHATVLVPVEELESVRYADPEIRYTVICRSEIAYQFIRDNAKSHMMCLGLEASSPRTKDSNTYVYKNTISKEGFLMLSEDCEKTGVEYSLLNYVFMVW